MKEIDKKEVKLSDFLPSLRKLANYLIENVDYGTIKDACEALDLNVDATYVAIHKCKKKGLDLMDYVADHWRSGLRKAKPLVRNSLIRRAIAGTAADRKLYFQLTGDLVNRQEIDHRIEGLFAVISPQDTRAGYGGERG